MKTLILYVTYEEKDRTFLQESIRLIDHWKCWEPSVWILSAWDAGRVLGNVRRFAGVDSDLSGERFIWQYLDLLDAMRSEKWDRLAILEGDIRITEDNLGYLQQHDTALRPTPYRTGLIPFETFGATDYLVGMTTRQFDYTKVVDKDGERYAVVSGPEPNRRMLPSTHQCSLTLSRHDFDALLSEGHVPTQPVHCLRGQWRRFKDMDITASATNWTWQHCFLKAVCMTDIERAMIQHCDHYRRGPIGITVDEWFRYIRSKCA